jgi:hypothetical protein
MNKLIEIWTETWFTECLFTLSLVVGLVVSVRNKESLPQLKYFKLYFGSFLLLQLYSYIALALYFETSKYVPLLRGREYLDVTVTMIELQTFLFFFYVIIDSKKKKTIVQVLGIFAAVLFGVVIVSEIFVFAKLRYKTIASLYIVESITLLAACSLYYSDTFKNGNYTKGSGKIDFWISSGLTIYLTCTLPSTIITYNLFRGNFSGYLNLYGLIYVFYIILNMTIIKAYLCKSAKPI